MMRTRYIFYPADPCEGIVDLGDAVMTVGDEVMDAAAAQQWLRARHLLDDWAEQPSSLTMPENETALEAWGIQILGYRTPTGIAFSA